MTPPQRNIFAPGARASRSVDILPQENQISTPDDRTAETEVLQAEETAAPPLMTVNLRYIGFIESAQRMIALVVLEGQAIAVVEGEVVGEGIRIGKISREQVEIVLPDSSTRLFSLEGE
jgi:Tfp pilus assembly protein PilP